MIYLPAIPGGLVNFCDDLRFELGNKISIMGLYSGDIIINGHPPAILSLSFYAMFLCPSDKGTKYNFKLYKATVDQEEVLFETDFEVPPLSPEDQNIAEEAKLNGGHPHTQFRFHGHLDEMMIEGPTNLRLRAYSGDDEYRMGSTHVKFSADRGGAKV